MTLAPAGQVRSTKSVMARNDPSSPFFISHTLMADSGSILGHTEVMSSLQSDLRHGNVSHAYLFVGPPFIGKSTVARWFATQLLSAGVESDVQKAQISDAIARLIHPDFLSLDALWVEGVMEDWTLIAQSSNIDQSHRSKNPKARSDAISIDEIRAIHTRLYETGSSPYLCCFLRSVDRMQAPAATSLLKILEEPPPRVVFLLTTERQSDLLPTIVSRARILPFQPLAASDLSPLLARVEPDDRDLFFHLSQGAPGTLLRLIDRPELLRAEKTLIAQARQFWQTMTLSDRMRWLSEHFKNHATQDQVLLRLGLALRAEGIGRSPDAVRAYLDLASALKTNAHRSLVLQRFALALP